MDNMKSWKPCNDFQIMSSAKYIYNHVPCYFLDIFGKVRITGKTAGVKNCSWFLFFILLLP